MLWTLLVLCASGMLGAYAYARCHNLADKRRALAVKAVASAVFVAVGIVCLHQRPDRFGVTLIIGLALGFFADVVIGYRNVDRARKQLFFSLGAVLFAAGHVAYIAAMSMLSPIPPVFYLASVALGCGVCVIPMRFFGISYRRMAPLIFGYSIILSVMLLSTLSAALFSPVHSPLSLVALAAGTLFAASDITMLFQVFVRDTYRANLVNLLCYYAGQLTFALCILLMPR